MQAESVPHGRRGLDRFLYLVREAEEYDQLSTTYTVDVEQMQEKLKALDGFALVAVMSTLQFALRHVPDQLDREEWWTLEVRRKLTSETLASQTAPSKPSPSRRRKVREGAPTSMSDDRTLAATS